MAKHAGKGKGKNSSNRTPTNPDPTGSTRGDVDPDLTAKLHAAIAPFDVIGLRAEARSGVAYLRGLVASHVIREQVEYAVLEVPGIRGLISGLVVDSETPRDMLLAADLEPLLGSPEEVAGIPTIPGTEPEFNKTIGTTDSAMAADGSDVFYPPTDPVVRPIGRNSGDLEIVGGWSAGSLDSPISAEDRPTHYARGDEEVEEDVKRALGEDSATTDLDIRVLVRGGVVFLFGRVGSIEDADLAEEVAGRVDGVSEVREELEVAGL